MEYSVAGGKLIHEKTRSKKSRDTVPLMWILMLDISFRSLAKKTIPSEMCESNKFFLRFSSF
jgi:hypothetical protein